MDIYNYFLAEKDRLGSEVAVAEKKLQEAPERHVSLNNKGRGSYLCIKNSKGERKYIKKSEYGKYLPNIKKMVLEKQLKYDKMYLKAIDRFLKDFNPQLKSAEEFLMENEDIAKVLCMNIKSVTKKAQDWFEEAYYSEPLFPEKRIIKTIHGEKVRSKSECMIADALLAGGLPYRYEWKRKFFDVVIHPDFIIMHPVTGEFYIWEHLGLADNSEYLAENLKKLELYARAGFISGKNLIITTESEEHPLDSDTVKLVIARFFS